MRAHIHDEIAMTQQPAFAQLQLRPACERVRAPRDIGSVERSDHDAVRARRVCGSAPGGVVLTLDDEGRQVAVRVRRGDDVPAAVAVQRDVHEHHARAVEGDGIDRVPSAPANDDLEPLRPERGRERRDGLGIVAG